MKPPSQVSTSFTQAPLSNKQEASKRDQGTSPVQFLSTDQLEPSSVHEAAGQWDHQRRDPRVVEQRSSSLDQLWQRFCERWSVEETRPTNDRDASLLERLERLSRLIHSTKAANVSGQRQKEYHDQYSMKQKLGKTEPEAGREGRRHAIRGDGLRHEARETQRNMRGSRRTGDDPPVHHHTWTPGLQVEETSQPVEDDSCGSYASNLSHSSLQSQHLCPADKDETETLSTASGSMSTVDTDRLVRAFGAHRVKHLKTSSSLGKLYSAISKQKEGREQRGGRNRDAPLVLTPSETTGTDASVRTSAC